MFDAIAGRYDLLNHLLSGGLDLLWRRRLVRECGLSRGTQVLDVCCGTGDLGLAFAKAGARVTGCDFSPGMLARSRTKGLRMLATGDALRLPFANGSFDAAVCAFGFRNTADWPAAARELARVVRRGGAVGVLDFGMPAHPLIAAPYRLYLQHVLPWLAGILSRRGAYEYLQASIDHFQRSADVAALLAAAGCDQVRRTALAFGTAVLWIGIKGKA
jgi:demethylmenaquinone methyltransferase/2-methoxy-6-polyprenyl-1,4-benzoquinol methylase